MKEHFGTSPVSDSYFGFVSEEDYDKMIRDLIISSACEFKEIPPEEDDAIWIDLSGEEIIMSKGFKDFFNTILDL